MLLRNKRSLKRLGNIWILLMFSFLLWNPASTKADGRVELSGTIQVKTDSSITVNSVEVLVNSSTTITGRMHNTVLFDSLKVGNFVHVVAYSHHHGSLIAQMIVLVDTHPVVQFNGSISALTANSLKVNGTEIFVDSTTVIYTQYHAALKFSDLKTGDQVWVRASQQNDGTYLAVSVMVITKNTNKEIELEGAVQEVTSNSIKVHDTVFIVDTTTVILKEGIGIIPLTQISVGDQVDVHGFLRPDSTYLALMIKVEGDTPPHDVLEFEGKVTAITSSSLDVNGVTCNVDSGTVVFAQYGTLMMFSDLKVGDKVEVKATRQTNGTYLATKIKLESDSSHESFEVEGAIQAVGGDSLNVGSYVIHVTSQTKIYSRARHNLTLADLTIGTYIHANAYLQNGKYFASQIKVQDHGNTEIHLTGSIDNISGTTLTVKGTAFITDQNTEFLDNNRNAITINDLKIGQIVTVEATVQAPNQYYAVRVKVNDFWRPFVVVEGPIDLLTANSLTVSNKTFLVDSTTVFKGNGIGVFTFLSLKLGIKVEVKGVTNANGNLVAKLIKIHFNNEYEVTGKIDTIMTKQFKVAGLILTTDSTTIYYGPFGKTATFDSLKVGQFVEVRYTKVDSTTNLAVRVEIENEPNSAVFSGTITSSTSSSLQLSVPSFSISSNTVFISSSYTQIQSSSVQTGQTVTVWATQNPNGTYSANQVQQTSSAITSVENGNKNEVPTSFELKQSYPNPFNPSTNISFSMAHPENVVLKVYNIIGQEVATLINGPMDAGSHVVTFNAANLSSGIYFYQLKAGSQIAIKKMVLLK